jgi:CRISPR/Cas system-associated exonuclease Cas4 (RecB family)
MEAFPLEMPKVSARLNRVSHSSLLQIERCPRQWQLMNSEYEQFVSTRGTYPQRVWPKTLIGLVVHKTLEKIVKTARSTDGENDQVRFFHTLKSLGGLSSLVSSISQEVLADVARNPRSIQNRGSLEQQLKRSRSEIREDVQAIISRLTLSSVVMVDSTHDEKSRVGIRSPGDYSEVWVSNNEIGWIGQIDVLRVTVDGVEIEDFKSGQSKEDHSAQLHTYAALWETDLNQNPDELKVSALRIRYPSKVVEVELPDVVMVFETLRQKATQVRELVNVDTPVAYPNVDTCHFCDVKQICSDYLRQLENVELSDGVLDVGLMLLNSLPSGTSGDEWEAEVRVRSKAIRVRVVLGGHYPALTAGMRLVVNGASVSLRNESEQEGTPFAATIVCRSNSEVFADIQS